LIFECTFPVRIHAAKCSNECPLSRVNGLVPAGVRRVYVRLALGAVLAILA